MNERTLCQMEVHPELIRLRRERTALFKKWQEMYGCSSPFQNMAGYGSAYMQGIQQSPFSALISGLIGPLGSQPASKFPWEQP